MSSDELIKTADRAIVWRRRPRTASALSNAAWPIGHAALEHGVIDSVLAEVEWSYMYFWACSIAGVLAAVTLPTRARLVALSALLGLLVGWALGSVALLAFDGGHSWPVARAATLLALALSGAVFGALAGVRWARRSGETQ